MWKNKFENFCHAINISYLICVQKERINNIFNFLFAGLFLFSVFTFLSTNSIFLLRQRNIMIWQKSMTHWNIWCLGYNNLMSFFLLLFWLVSIPFIFKSRIEIFVFWVFFIFIFFYWFSLAFTRSFFFQALNILEFQEWEIKWFTTMINTSSHCCLSSWLPHLFHQSIVILAIQKIILLSKILFILINMIHRLHIFFFNGVHFQYIYFVF